MLDSLFRLLARLARVRPAPAPRRRARPGLEPLEARWVPSAIGGTVYNDVNRNGLFDTGEPGIAGNTLQLQNASGATIATTTTDANGHYLFTVDQTVSTAPATKEVDAAFAAATTNSTQTQTVAQFNPALGTLTGIDLVNDGTLTSHIKVQSLDGAPSTVTGTVSGNLTLTAPGVSGLVTNPTSTETTQLVAYNGTGSNFTGPSSFDFGDKSAEASNTVTLNASGQDLSPFIGTGTVTLTETAQATSSASGPGNLLALINSTASANVKVIYHYTPSNALQPGQYTVVQPQVPQGYVPGQTTGDNVHPLPFSPPPESIPVTLTSSGDSLNNNFGELQRSSLAGFVYLDGNNNGSRDPGEAGVPNVTVNLSGTDYLGNPVSQTQLTAGDGSYIFGTLRPGNYTLSTVQPPGFQPGAATAGSLGGTVSGDQITITNLAPGVQGTNYNFGEVLPAVPVPPSLPEVPTPPPAPFLPPPTPFMPPAPTGVDLSGLLSKRDFVGNAWMSWGW